MDFIPLLVVFPLTSMPFEGTGPKLALYKCNMSKIKEGYSSSSKYGKGVFLFFRLVSSPP